MRISAPRLMLMPMRLRWRGENSERSGTRHWGGGGVGFGGSGLTSCDRVQEQERFWPPVSHLAPPHDGLHLPGGLLEHLFRFGHLLIALDHGDLVDLWLLEGGGVGAPVGHGVAAERMHSRGEGGQPGSRGLELSPANKLSPYLVVCQRVMRLR
jgi:hypothetical protein